MSNERRKAERLQVWFPMRLDAQAAAEVLVMSQNVSRVGALVAIGHQLAPGERVTLTFSVPPNDDEPRQLTGRVVRYEDNDNDPDGLWPYRVAVALDEEAPELESLLQWARERQSRPPSQ